MDEDSDRSSEGTQLEDNPTAEEKKHDEDSGDVDEDEEDYDGTDDQTGASALESSLIPIEEDSRTSSETLVYDVPVRYEMRLEELEHLKNQLQGSHQEALAVVIAQAAQAHSKDQIKLPGVPSSSSELSPISITPISSLPSSISQKQLTSPENTASIRVAEADQKLSSYRKTSSASRTGKTPIDGYNWRKYGQKQVKSPQGSRSYYKCTFTECDAKKIESLDQYNSVTKLVFKGQHTHDPPKKVFSRGGKILSTSSKSLKRKIISTPGSNEYKSSGPVTNSPIEIEQMDEPLPKQRVKKSSSASPGSVLKSPKKPKFVVHAAGDIGISADGYRWRKYGQKAVKGNPHPRNYYKCTSAGCPVRKHTEMAVDGTSEVIITYKGVHDHDTPVPKKHQSPPSHLLIAAASPTSKTTSISKRNGVSTTDASNDTASESARTLLSVGFEIQPY